ncbi:hypothetical protein V6D40_05725 [Corynebacterium sp. Q4381]|uniref:hypothetical protein n=1 Tax=Corynebacterium sp. Marseille-Q4381 TaxID=3121597 RepID=UPI002FE6844A
MTNPYDTPQHEPFAGSPYVYSNQAPQPEPEKERNTAGIAVGSVLGAIVVVFGGLLAFQQVRDVPAGPLGWSDKEVNEFFEAGELKTCNLGDEFYGSVGMRSVDWSTRGCEGLIDSGEGFPLAVTFDPHHRPSGEFKPDIHHHNWMYREAAAPRSLDAVAYTTKTGAECVVVSTREEYKEVSITVDGPCEAVNPLINQLDNLADQYQFSSDKRGLFDFSAPEYKDVAVQPVSAVSDAYREAREVALAPGETVEVPEEEFDGSQFTFTNAWFEDRTLRYEAAFTLGNKDTPGTSTFYLPEEFVAMYPNGDQVALKRDASFSLDVGATETFQGESEHAIYEWDEFVIIATNTDGAKAVWAFG